MARLDKNSCPGNWEQPIPWTKEAVPAWKVLEAQLKELEAKSALIDPNGDLTGAVIRFPVADGYAFYIVSKDKPLTLQHIPFGDRYSIPMAHIRGIRREDIIWQLKTVKFWKEDNR